jgi:hypothetical protein
MEEAMKIPEYDGTAEEFAAEAHKLPGQADSQDTAAAWAAVAAWAAGAEAGREPPESLAPGIVPPGVPSLGFRASARCPGPDPARPGPLLAGLRSACDGNAMA